MADIIVIKNRLAMVEKERNALLEANDFLTKKLIIRNSHVFTLLNIAIERTMDTKRQMLIFATSPTLEAENMVIVDGVKQDFEKDRRLASMNECRQPNDKLRIIRTVRCYDYEMMKKYIVRKLTAYPGRENPDTIKYESKSELGEVIHDADNHTLGSILDYFHKSFPRTLTTEFVEDYYGINK